MRDARGGREGCDERGGRDEYSGLYATATATATGTWPRARGLGRAHRAGAVVLATVTGVAVLAACGLEDHRETAGGTTPRPNRPSPPRHLLPSGERLGPDAHVPSPTGVDGTAHGRDGWTGTGPRGTVYVKPARSGMDEPWRVDEVRTVGAAVSAPDPSGPDSAASSTTSPSPSPSPSSPSARPE